MLDYDGTLTVNHKIPDFAKPSKQILEMLSKLSQLSNVYILSGRSRQHLDLWFADINVGLSAEHGCFLKHATLSNMTSSKVSEVSNNTSSKVTDVSNTSSKDGSWIGLVNEFDTSWRNVIRPLFQHYTERTPGSFVEEKEMLMTWHYRNADPEFGQWQAAELQVNLEKTLSHLAVSIVLGNKTLELRPSSIDKSTAVRCILKEMSNNNEDCFILAIGDGKTDEVVFSLLRDYPNALTCTVGRKQTEALYYLDNVTQVENILNSLCDYSK